MGDVAGDIPQALGDLFSEILNLRGVSDSKELQDRLNAGAVKILKLKAIHRAMCNSTEALREATGDAKTQLDQSSLQLQSLLYEKHHYEKEIQSCTSFRSAYSEQQLELLPVEEYKSRASASAMAVDDDKDFQEDLDPHQLMLNRLHHELEFREETVKELEGLKAKRDGLAADVAQKRSSLAGLDAEISKLRTSAQRVQRHYGVEVVGIHSGDHSDRLAALLPASLYLLYTHLSAVAATEKLPLQISITGEHAVALRKQMASALVRSPSAPANVVETALAKAAEEATASTQDAGSQVFPLAVEVEVKTPATAEKKSSKKDNFIATFHYSPSLNVVTVSGKTPAQDALLASLFGDQRGEGQSAAAAEGVLGKAYSWAQRAAGLDLLPPVEHFLAKGGGIGGSAGLAAVHQYQHERRAAAVAAQLVQAAANAVS
jgi:THO complex subunit 5